MTEIKTWHEGMTDKETADLAYWERNMLALRYADGWYNDDWRWADGEAEKAAEHGYVLVENKPRFLGWRRVLSLEGGKITFHIPDDFDVGNLKQIEPNWDGHTTEEKWRRVMQDRLDKGGSAVPRLGEGAHEELEARSRGIGEPLSAMELMALEAFRDLEKRHKDGRPVYPINRRTT